MKIIPVLPSSNISRDLAWYETCTGFTCSYKNEHCTVLQQDHLFIHLQWRSATEEDPFTLRICH